MVHRSQVNLILDEIIFQGRNKKYGAYELRRKYNSNLIKSVAIAFFVFTLALSLPKILSFFIPMQEQIVVMPPIISDPFDFNGFVVEKPISQNVNVAPKAISSLVPTKIVDDNKVPVDIVPTNNVDVPSPAKPAIDGATGSTYVAVGALPEEIPVTDKAKPFEVWAGEKQIFNGGELNKFLGKEIRYPSDAQNNHISGRVTVEFIIEKDGSVTNVKAVKRIGFGCDEEAERVIRLTTGMWTPGKNNGHAVRLKITQPMYFRLQEN